MKITFASEAALAKDSAVIRFVPRDQRAKLKPAVSEEEFSGKANALLYSRDTATTVAGKINYGPGSTILLEKVVVAAADNLVEARLDSRALGVHVLKVTVAGDGVDTAVEVKPSAIP